MKGWGAILRSVVIVWAVLCFYCLCRAEQEPPVYDEEPAAEPIQVAVLPEPIEEVEEPQDVMANLPSIENATLTHYCICKQCCGKDEDHPAYGITASGRKAEPFVSVAVDPILIPLGSKVYVDYGDGEVHEYRADDTGSAVTGAKIDLCVSDHETALNLGKQTVKVWWSE